MGALDGVVILEGERAVLDEFEASRCDQWELYCIIVEERRTLPKLLWGGLVDI